MINLTVNDHVEHNGRNGGGEPPLVQGPDVYVHAPTEKRTLGGDSNPGDAMSGVVYRSEPAD
jgi:hypothetical protein